MDKAAIHFILISALACGFTECDVAQAQEPNSGPDYFKHNFTAAFVGEVKAGPNGGVSGPLNNAPGFSVDYLFQPRRWLALEAGYVQIVRPIGSSVCCEFASNLKDELYLVPFGVHYVWSPRTSRVRLTAGGGGAYVNHTNGVGIPTGPFGFVGWGGQFVASGDVALTKSRWLRLDFTARYYFASPKPTPFPGIGVPDHLHIFVIGPGVTFRSVDSIGSLIVRTRVTMCGSGEVGLLAWAGSFS